MAKKARKQQITDDPNTEQVDEARAARQENPDGFAGLEVGPDQVDYIEVEAVRERRITFNGLNYEHVSEDADGIWVYRQM